MRIISLKLKNFRQYYGEQKIDFECSDSKNITIVFGQNGEGKTGIFRSVIFSLFGEAILSAEKNDKKNTESKDKIHIVNFNKLTENLNEPVEAFVEIIFEHNEIKYIIKRSIIEMMESNGKITTADDTEVEMKIVNSNGNVNPNVIRNDDEIQGILSNILDKKLKDFFLFDADRIESISKTDKETRKHVKSGIIKLLQIDSVGKAIEILKKMQAKEQRNISRFDTGRLKELRKDLLEKEQEKSNLEKDIENIENEIENCVELIEEYKEKLSKNEDIKKIYDEINQLNIQYKNKKERLNDLNFRAKDTLKKCGSSLLLEDYLISIKSFLEQDDISKEYSIDISIQLIESILENRECICGNKFDIDSDSYRKLNELKNTYKKSELNQFVTSFKNKVDDYYYDRSSYQNSLEEILKNYNDIEKEIEKIAFSISNLEEKVKDFSASEENLKEIENSLERYNDKFINLKSKNNRYISDLDKVNREIKDLDNNIEKEERQDTMLKQYYDRKVYLKRICEHFENIEAEYSEEMRNRISKETTEIFKNIICKNDSDLVDSITINKEYEIQVETSKWSNKITGDISAGQRQMVSLAFVIALAKVAAGDKDKMDVPLFMDTPFGRISGENRDNVIQNLPLLTNQWILLMTDTEFTKNEERQFKNTGRVNNIYVLNKIKDGYTVITKVDDVENTSIARR